MKIEIACRRPSHSNNSWTANIFYQKHLNPSIKMSAPELSSDEMVTLTKSWLAYVRNEREEAGMKRRLPHSTCCSCGKSRTSYPHWPPTTHGEAIAQLRCLIGTSYPHRLYLADCWISSIYREQAQSWPNIAVSEAVVSLVRNACGKATKDDLENPGERVRKAKVDCQEICELVLQNKSCFCLYCCPEHREECPVHRCG